MSETLVDPPAKNRPVRRIPAKTLLGGVPRNGRHFFRWYLRLGLLQRLVIGSVIGLLGGSTFIAFINTYAVYRYAFRFDVRIPVEGVPYLALAASILSGFFLFSALVCAIPVYGLLRAITSLSHAVVIRIAPTWKTIRTDSADQGSRWGTLLAMEVLTGLLSAITTILLSLKFSASLPSIRVAFPAPIVIAGISLALLGLTALSVRPRWVHWVPIYLTAGLVVATSFALFSPAFYAARLRQIRYGGGTPITLVCDRGTLCEQGRTLHLFLITSDTYLVYDDRSKEIIEVPESEVKRVRYVRTREYTLPAVIQPEPLFDWQLWWRRG